MGKTSCLAIRDIDRNKGPYEPRSASSKTDDWPYWMVCPKGSNLNCIIGFVPGQKFAEAICDCANGTGPCECGKKEKTMTEQPTCETCLFSAVAARDGVVASHGYEIKDGRARCCRYPPMCPSTRLVYDYPIVSLRDWCGEHQPKSPTNE